MVYLRKYLGTIEQEMVFRSTLVLIIVRKKISSSLVWKMAVLVAAVIPTEAKEKILMAVRSIAYKERMITQQNFNPQKKV